MGKLTQEEADKIEAADNKRDEDDAKKEEEKKKKEQEEKEKLHSIKSRLNLKNINLEIQEGEFVCIIGETGSGKTSLLNAIFGEMAYVSDKQIEEFGGLDAEYAGPKLFELHREVIRSQIEQAPIVKRGKTAYVEQNPWIQNMTIRDNILFDQPIDEERYVKTVMACCLERDFEILKSGDLSEIGERGINLSGGQKARLSLARAVYADKDIYLMDDPISALDAHVRKQIFKRVFRDMLRNKTRILVTHAIDFMHLADRVVVMKEGEIKVQGTYEEVLENEIVKEIVKVHNKHKENLLKQAEEAKADQEEGKADKEAKEVAESTEVTSEHDDDVPSGDEGSSGDMARKGSSLVEALTPEKIQQKLKKFSRGKGKEEGKLMKDEDDEKEELEKSTIMKAVNTIGGKAFWAFMFMSYLIQSVYGKYNDYVLKNMSA